MSWAGYGCCGRVLGQRLQKWLYLLSEKVPAGGNYIGRSEQYYSGLFHTYGIGPLLMDMDYGVWNIPYGLSYSIRLWIESLRPIERFRWKFTFDQGFFLMMHRKAKDREIVVGVGSSLRNTLHSSKPTPGAKSSLNANMQTRRPIPVNTHANNSRFLASVTPRLHS